VYFDAVMFCDCSTDLSVVLQRAVKKHSALLQSELDRIKAELNAKTTADLLAPTQSCKLAIFPFDFAQTGVDIA